MSIELPKGFRVEKPNKGEAVYSMESSINSVREHVVPTKLGDGSKILIVRGSGLESWGLADSLFPERENGFFDKVGALVNGNHSVDGTALAVPVFNGKDELIGCAIGRGNTGTVSGLDGKIVVSSIISKKGSVVTLPENERFKVEMEREGSKIVFGSNAEDIVMAVKKINAREQALEVIKGKSEIACYSNNCGGKIMIANNERSR